MYEIKYTDKIKFKWRLFFVTEMYLNPSEEVKMQMQMQMQIYT